MDKKDRIKWHPLFTKELLAGITYKLKSDHPLSGEEKSFLIAAFEKILKGEKPEKAFYLTNRVGRPDTTLSEESIEIYNLVEEYLKQGKTLAYAYKKIESESIIDPKWAALPKSKMRQSTNTSFRKSTNTASTGVITLNKPNGSMLSAKSIESIYVKLKNKRDN